MSLVLDLVNTKLGSPAFKLLRKIGNEYGAGSHVEVSCVCDYHIQPATGYINFILCITFLDHIISLCYMYVICIKITYFSKFLAHDNDFPAF